MTLFLAAARRTGQALILGLAVGAPAGPGFAQSLDAWGDGSATNNPDLGSTNANSGCSQACAGMHDPNALPGVVVTDDRLLPADRPMALNLPPPSGSRPPDPNVGYFTPDWSVTLRGSYVDGSQGQRIGMGVLPEVSLSREDSRGTLDVSLGADIEAMRGEQPRLAGLDASGERTFQLDRLTGLDLKGSVSVSQDDPKAPGTASNVKVTPIAVDGAGSIGLDRRFGRLNLEGTGDFARYYETGTGLKSGLNQSNDASNYWQLGGTLRAGYEMSPGLTPFAEGGAHYSFYDAAPVSTGTRSDGWDYIMRGGLAADWRGVLTGEISAGYEWREFDASTLNPVSATVYSVDVTYQPRETVSIGATLSTTLDSGNPDTGTKPSVTYDASADASYLLTPWLTMRGSISGTLTDPKKGKKRTLGYGFGLGADWSLSRSTSLSLDYGYDETFTPPGPAEYEHLVQLGMTVSR